MQVLGRTRGTGPAGRIGRYRARDGSDGAPVGVDLAGPHAAVVVGKRGAGKSYTLGVLAEELAATSGVVPVVVDPMGAFGGLRASGAAVTTPRVRADALPAEAWPDLFGLDPTGAVGGLLWRVAAECGTLAGMREAVAAADCPAATRRAAGNHLRLAARWEAFAPDGLAAPTEATVLDVSEWRRAPMNAVVRAVAAGLYDRRVAGDGPLPWLLVDEAHAFDGVAAPALRRLLTRGRAPGVSLVLATQRPSALPAVAHSQADLLVAHRLTGERDLAALRESRPSYLRGDLADRIPTRTGGALVIDDATERAHAVQVRERETPHGGDAARVPKGTRSPGD